MTSNSDFFSLADQVVLVTGATRGIGRAICERFGKAGAKVFVAGREIDAAQQVASEIPDAIALTLDVTDATSVKAAILRLRKEAGRLDVLVNNAGIMKPAMLPMSSEADLELMFETNVKGSFLCSQLSARLMISRKSGSIINMASIMGVEGASGFSTYAATKAAVVGMTHALAKELAPYNVRVNALAPGFIKTDLTAETTGELRQNTLRTIKMGRFGTVEDVALAAQFLACPASEYITGQVLGVDGAMQV